MRQFLNAYEGYNDEQVKFQEQIRLVCFYTLASKGSRITRAQDLYKISGEWSPEMNADNSKTNKEDLYKLLDKWSK